MQKSESITNLSAALSLAQAEMPVVPFDAKNPFFKSSYATLGAVIATSKPILAKHGLSICQFPISEGPLVGIDTTLLHSSGEWISESILVPLDAEKGNSLIQVVGKDLTYLKRYSWSSVCGLYADEDTDGNGSGNMPTQPQRQATPARPAQAAKPAAAPAAAPASTQRPILPRSGPLATEATRAWMIKELADMQEGAWEYFVGNGSLIPTETLEQLPLEFVPTSREQMAALKEHIKAKFAASSEPPGMQEPPMDGNGNGNGAADDCNSPDAPWRSYPLPFAGKKGTVAKGTELAQLDKDYLYGLVKNITVKTEYNGRPLTPDQIAKSEEFRHMLDEAGRHYKFE